MSTSGDWTGSGSSVYGCGWALENAPPPLGGPTQLIQWNPTTGAGLHGKHGLDFRKMDWIFEKNE